MRIPMRIIIDFEVESSKYPNENSPVKIASCLLDEFMNNLPSLITLLYTEEYNLSVVYKPRR